MFLMVVEVVGVFIRVWQEFFFDDIFCLVVVFIRIYNMLVDFVGCIFCFVGVVVWQILLFIKDVLLGWLWQNVNYIFGYSLLLVIFGCDIFI